MKKVYFTVGPSQIYPTIPKHISNALKEDILSLNHRGQEFKNLYKDTARKLKVLLNIPKDYQILFTSCGLEGMERTIQGVVEKTSFHIISGYFGKAWARYAAELGKNVLSFDLNTDNYNIDKVEIPQKAELICVTQNDTSTGIWIPPIDIEKIKKKYPEKLIAIDVVSSLPHVDINYKYVDITFFSVQKGFGLPAGLGVIILNPKALEKTEQLVKKNISIGSYHGLKNLSEKAKDFQTPETPNVLNIYLLNKVAGDILKTGIDKIRKETDEKSRLIYDFFENHNRYYPVVSSKKLRSPTTIVIYAKEESEKLRKRLADKGYIVGAGYGENKLTQIRIANFPSHNLRDLKKLLKTI